MRTAPIATALLACMGAVCPAPAQLEVRAVRFWSLPEATRIAVEANGDFQFRSERLSNPDRVFFDLLAATPRMGVKGVHVTPVGDKLLKRIRVAETQPGMTRVVLDLEPDVSYTASQLSNPDRLMIELRPAELKPVSRQTPATAAPDALPAAVVETVSAVERAVPEPAPVAAAVAAPVTPAAAKPAAPPPPPAMAAKRNSSGERTLIRALGLKVGRVVIDPGHGGHDHGSTGKGGLMEKELVLDVAQRLGALVEERLGSEVIYTRTDDTFIPLETRTGMANEKSADLFVSIHANSSPYRNVSGVETYYLNLTSSRDELDLAARENAGSQKTIHELGEIIQKIAKRDKAQESREFAVKMQSSLYSAAAQSNPAARNRGVKKAPFVVLIGAMMPSILCEIGFVSNPREEALLKKPEHRQRLAEALYKGLARYAETLSHFQVASKD
jgi:N-acetylmuramoyl-L-alanine amidase